MCAIAWPSNTIMKALLIYLTLKAHGWTRCEMADGRKGWRRQVTPTCSRVGPTEYAIAHLLR